MPDAPTTAARLSDFYDQLVEEDFKRKFAAELVLLAAEHIFRNEGLVTRDA